MSHLLQSFQTHLCTNILAYIALTWPPLSIFLSWDVARSRFLLIICAFVQLHACAVIYLYGKPLRPLAFALAMPLIYCWAGLFGLFGRDSGKQDLDTKTVNDPLAFILLVIGNLTCTIALISWDCAQWGTTDKNKEKHGEMTV